MAYERFLLLKINRLRKLMIEAGMHHGMNHQKTILISQELDILLVKYQLFKSLNF